MLTRVILSLIVFVYMTTDAVYASSQFYTEYDKRFAIGVTKYARSKTDCAAHCLQDDGCCFVSYKNTTHECIIGRPVDCHYAKTVTALGWQFLRRGRIFNKKKVFYYINDRKTWYNSQQYCEDFGMRLATTSSYAEDEFLKGLTDRFIGTWLGGTDLAVDGVWEWQKPSVPITYNGWYTFLGAQLEPNGFIVSNCLCFWLYVPDSYDWVDEPCYFLYASICESVIRPTNESWPIV